MSYWQKRADGILVHCHIQPKASRNAVVGIHNDRLKIQITATPTDGKANAHLLKYLAGFSNLPKSSIHLLRGASSRQKSVLLSGLDDLPGNFP
jgi:uncharacterized protein